MPLEGWKIESDRVIDISNVPFEREAREGGGVSMETIASKDVKDVALEDDVRGWWKKSGGAAVGADSLRPDSDVEGRCVDELPRLVRAGLGSQK